MVPLAPPLLLLAGAALLASAGFGPATISLFELIDGVAPDAGVEAMTTTAEALGIGAGSLEAGFAVSGLGARAPLEAAPVILAVGLIAVAAGDVRVRRALRARGEGVRSPPIR